METKLRVAIADDERPARSFLAAMLGTFPEVELIGEAANGAEAIELIEQQRPDLALLDLQMPEVDGLGVVRLIRKDRLPLIAFVTAYDEYAVRAFELNAVDYLLKPVERARLQNTLNRAQDRLERADLRDAEAEHLNAAVTAYETATRQTYLERIPIRQREEIVLVPVERVASIIADGELLHLTVTDGQRHSFSYRLKDLEGRLDPAKFVRLSRGALVNVNQISRISPLPGGTYVVTLHNRQQLNVSRIQARILREQLLKL
ncbi:MAG TPA: response regulator [Blastocatellia bacterium]|nr:response regulator [Blastocatellia bacterium]HMX29801.1 response regulator [Blastocatellia bacterium]HMY74954.1 response regulator [Blastocatellia bacterium]HMZ22894.1 response regulator [Blastocatellia bacterium]HNG28398.1 response regulator [Blastocatellia bacterium]